MEKTFKHPKFTATFNTEKNYISFTGSYQGGIGACGDSISKIYPDFAIVNAYHLCDKETGKPMHAWENADYHAKEYDIKALMRHLKVSENKAILYADTVQSVKRFERLEENLTPYRKHVCSFSWKKTIKNLDDKSKRKLAIYDKEQIDAAYKRCSYEWIEKVEFAKTFSLSGEKTVYCPKCLEKKKRKRPVESSPWCNKEGDLWEHERFKTYKESFGLFTRKLAEHKETLGVLKLALLKKWETDLKTVYQVIEDTPSNLFKENPDYDPENYDPKIIALTKLLDCNPDDIKDNDPEFSVFGNYYLVLDDDEREIYANDYLESYIDDCMDIPDNLEPYFDRKKFKRDAIMIDGYGHILGRYDGKESISNNFYVYRM